MFHFKFLFVKREISCLRIDNVFGCYKPGNNSIYLYDI